MTIRETHGAVVTGWYADPVTRTEVLPARELLLRAVDRVLKHAGLERTAIDGFAASGFTLGPDNTVDLAVAAGLQVGWLKTPEPGGTGAIDALAAAAEAVGNGSASAVVCVGADRMDAPTLASLGANFSSVYAQALEPVGASAANVTFAFLTDLYLRRHGLSRADLGELVVAQRANGARHPDAILPKAISMSEYLDSRPIVEPLHLFDCVMPGCAAAAVVVCNEEVAAQARHAVHVRAAFTSYGGRREDLLTFPWKDAAEDLYAAAALQTDELSGVQLYDDYPVMVAIQLEELGLVEVGQVAAHVREHGIGPDSVLPVNTGGGMLGCGQAGGAGAYVALIEALRQLGGEASDRQIPDATSQLVTGLGMVGYSGPQSFAAAVLATSRGESGPP